MTDLIIFPDNLDFAVYNLCIVIDKTIIFAVHYQ